MAGSTGSLAFDARGWAIASRRIPAYPEGIGPSEPTTRPVRAAGRLPIHEGFPMHRFANVLVYSRAETPSPPAMGRLANLAARYGAAIRLMAVIEPFPWYTRLLLPSWEEFQRMQTEQAADHLRSLATSMKRKDLKITTRVAEGRPALELIREVLRSDHDLLVKVAEPDPGNLFGSTDMHLLRNCPCPILLLHPQSQEWTFRRILVAVDPAPAPDVLDELHLREHPHPEEQAMNARLLDVATGLAEREGGEIHIVHAWSAPGEELLRTEGWVAHSEVESYVASLQERDRQAVEGLLDRCPPGSAPRHIHLIKGQPADVISEFAKGHQVDLIVMGTVVRTGIPGLLIGNTAETVLHQVQCSILAVKPENFVSPVTLDD
jgi:nucleotide-binding universal stress UspA family protein